MPAKMKPRYEPITPHERIAYLIEECGEALAAAGKSLRWGPDGFNPELPAGERETNAQWLLRELIDVERAIGFVREIFPSRPIER